MTKKIFFVLISLSLFLFFSCGSTKQENDNSQVAEPLVEETAVAEEIDTSIENEISSTDENTATEEASEEQENSDAAEAQTNEQEDIDELYPPLDEIEEPDFIDISPEEIEQQEAAKAALAEQAEIEKNKITEPVEEQEELPPLPESEDETEAEAGTEAEVESETGDTELSENQEETSIEPTIEVQTEEEAEPEPEILPSRRVSLKKGETLVITYPGNGWIYMGSTSEYNNLASRGRKLGTTDTKYTLLAKEAGTQIHHFYKVDNLTGEYIDDYIEVTVLEKKGNSSTVVTAPEYSQVVPKKPETPAKATPKPQVNTNTTEAEQTQSQTSTQASEKATDAPAAKTTQTTQTSKNTTVTQPKEDVIEVEAEDTVIVIDDDEEQAEETPNLEPLIEKARSLVSSKKYDDAYPVLIQYLEFSTENRDEALYLLGQILESNSKYRDIKQAVETYQTLCDSYPASKYWDNANKRIVYLKRFYINIH